MISYFFEGKIIVACCECALNGNGCYYPNISKDAGIKSKEDSSCTKGEPNEQLKTEIAKMNYQIKKVKEAQNVRQV